VRGEEEVGEVQDPGQEGGVQETGAPEVPLEVVVVVVVVVIVIDRKEGARTPGACQQVH